MMHNQPRTAFTAPQKPLHNTPSRDTCLSGGAYNMADPTQDSPAAPRSLKRRRTDSSSTAASSQPNNDNHNQRRHHHKLSNVQVMPPHTEPAPQDPAFTQAQLLRSICAALTIAGYDSVRPSALESFRAQVEEYMLHFLDDVKTSMYSARRTTPIPQDFTYALSAHNLTSSALEPHLQLPIPPELSAPKIAAPAPAEPPPPNLTPMLGPDLMTPAISANEVPASSYIPPHFPPLPSRHAYMATQTFTQREQDARKIREKATEEGILAEQALRRLTSAGRARRGERGSGKGGVEKAKAREGSWRDVVGELLLEEEQEGEKKDSGRDGSSGWGISLGESALSFDGAGDERVKSESAAGPDKLETLMRSGGLNVNHERGHWRRGAGAAVR